MNRFPIFKVDKQSVPKFTTTIIRLTHKKSRSDKITRILKYTKFQLGNKLLRLTRYYLRRKKLLPLANYWQPARAQKMSTPWRDKKWKQKKKRNEKQYEIFTRWKNAGLKTKNKRKKREPPQKKERKNSARDRYIFGRNSRKYCDKVDYRLKSRCCAEVPTKK